MNNIRNTDIYLIDQILKGNFDDFKTVLDVGCGNGRNLPYFLENEFEVFGIDSDEKRIIKSQELKNANPNNFKIGLAENIPFNQKFDLIICNAVLHFAKNETHFNEMIHSMWSKLTGNGILFLRLASDIGIENLVKDLGNRNYKLPDGSTRYLVNHKILIDFIKELNAKLVDPIKTTNVQNLRCMTTCVLRKLDF